MPARYSDPDHEEIDRHLARVDWAAARVPTEPVDLALMPDSDAEDHANAEDDDPIEDGARLRELTDDGEVDEGRFGDGAYVPAHWWEVR